MKRIGITGQPGFMGTHLFNHLSLKKDEVELVPFYDHYFSDEALLNNFVTGCDVIVHLAAMNRHGDPQVIYDTNIRLVNSLIESLEKNSLTPHVLFSSSTQEEKDTIYGKSKKEGRRLFEQWADRSGGKFNAIVIPNVFGPFGNPYYNSVIATFSHQLTHGETPRIEIDAEIRLIYINNLVKEFWKVISSDSYDRAYYAPFDKEISVSEILLKLKTYHEEYVLGNMIPDLNDDFDVSLFNTFKSYIAIESHYPFYLKKNVDSRGYLVEAVKESTGGQLFYSTTKPGITRGNHFHSRKIERFCVVSGEGEIKMRKIGTDSVLSFKVSGENPCTVDMPIFYTHSITNIGESDLLTLFWCNEIFSLTDTDTYFESV